MKTVFNTRQCAHVWAQQTQVSGRNAGNSAHFSGPTFYSYATPIAAIVETKRGKAVLITSERYSQTTNSKHRPAVSRAVSQYQTFRVPYVGYGGRSPGDVDHVKNKAYLVAQYHDAVKRLMRSPADSWRNDDAGIAATLSSHAKAACDYAIWSGLALPRLDGRADVAQILARRDRLRASPEYKNRVAARVAQAAAQAEANKKARAKQLAEMAGLIAQWRAGKPVLPSYVTFEDVDGGAMLRIVGNTVQTSLGAEVPLDHAARVYQWYKEAPRPWTATPGVELRLVALGQFRLDSIDTDGNVRAGCHLITRTELENFGKLLEQVK